MNKNTVVWILIIIMVFGFGYYFSIKNKNNVNNNTNIFNKSYDLINITWYIWWEKNIF